MLAGLGGLWSERAGVVNIGLEGMMILGTLGAGYFGYHYGPGRPASSAPSLVRCRSAALLHALATVIFGVDHIVSGVAINIIAAGRGRRSWPRRWFTDARGRRPDPVAAAAVVADDHDPGARRLRQRPWRTSTGSWSPTLRRRSAR